MAAAGQSQVELRAPGINSLPQGGPQIHRAPNRALFVPPIGSVQGAIRPQQFDAMLPEGRPHANVLDPGYATIDPSGLPPALGASIGGLNALRGTFRNRATTAGIDNAGVAVQTVADPCTGAIPGNPAWILGGLASASPGGSNGLSLTDVPALPALLDNMNLGSNPSTRNPVKYLSVVSQYCRGKEYHGMQLHLTPAENRSAYLTYRYHVKTARTISNAPDTPEARSFIACQLLKSTALELVVTYQNQNDEVPDELTVFILLESQLADSAAGLLTEALSIHSFHILSIAKELQARMKVSAVPDIAAVMSEVRTIRDRRNKIHPFDTLSYCLWLLHLMRGEAAELVEIREVASTKYDKGIKVQQLDPDAMIRSILSCGKQWKTFYQRQGNKAPVETPSVDDQGGRGRAAGTSGGGSGGDRRPSGPKRSNPTSRESDNKRPAGAAASRPGRAANSGGGGCI